MDIEIIRGHVSKDHIHLLVSVPPQHSVSKVVSKSRETEDNEKGEGSLSLFIVPIERWEISSVKAT